MIKKVVNAVHAGDKSAAEIAYRDAVPAIDRSVSKGIMHANKAARHKSRLAQHIKRL
jgi:small subunit ribosomal protein S20